MEKQEYEIVKIHTESDIETEAAKVGGRRNLREIPIKTEDGYEFVYLVKKPNRSVMQAINEYETKKNISGIEKLMIGCVLFGDKDAYEHDGAVYTRLLEEIGRLVTTAKGEAKKV